MLPLPLGHGFHPLSDLFTGECAAHAPWLASYFQFRRLPSETSRAELLQEVAKLSGSASALADRSRIAWNCAAQGLARRALTVVACQGQVLPLCSPGLSGPPAQG